MFGRSLRTVQAIRPARSGREDGLAYALWTPKGEPRGGLVVLHGAGSSKESHYDFARAALALDLAVLTFDQRGHGESDGPMDGRILADVETMTALLRSALGSQDAPIGVRGSSMGGYLAIVASEPVGAAATVAICPAPAEMLRRGLEHGAFDFPADAPALDAFLAEHDLEAAVQRLHTPLLLLHAEGDERVPVQSSRELAAHFSAPGSRLIAVPGGHHRSVQHDDELQAVSLRFLLRALSA